MKIAFCFLTLGDVYHPALWEKFLAGGRDGEYGLYCHAKERERVVRPLLAGHVIDEYVPTRHGHVSIVGATLALFAAALRDDPANAYFVLLSESTIPVVPFARVRDDLQRAEERSLIPYSVPPPGSEHHARLAAIADNAAYARAFYLHDQWIVLARRHVARLLERSHLAEFERLFAADEHYIMNVLAHRRGVPLDEVIARRTTFVNWQDREVRQYANPQTGQVVARTVHPKTYTTLTQGDLAAAGDAWFFRKVAADCDCRVALDRV